MPQPERSLWIAEGLGAAILVLLAGFYGAHPLFSVDVFWHLKLGEVIASTRSIPTTDLFSAVHPDSPWVQFQWLWELLAHLVVDRFGLGGLRGAHALLAGGTVLALHQVARRRLGSPWAALLLCAWALSLFEDRLRARPDATTWTFVVAILPWLLDGFPRRARGLVPLFAIAVLWSNIHGGAALLLVATAGARAVGDVVGSRVKDSPAAGRPAPWAGFRAVLVALAGVLASPTTAPGLVNWGSIVGPMMDAGNPEWEPTWTVLRYGTSPSLVWVAVAPTLVACGWLAEQLLRLRRTGRRALDLAEWFVCLGMLLLAHQAVRNVFLCVVPLAFMLRRFELGNAAGRLRAPLLGLTAVAIGWVGFQDAVLDAYGDLDSALEVAADYNISPGTQPEEAAAFLSDAGIEGPILNEGRWGGYLIYRCWPRSGIFIDTRHHLTEEMWRVFRASNDPLRRPLAMEQAFRAWGIGLAVFEGPTFPLHTPPAEWALLYKAGGQEVYHRVDHPQYRANRRRAVAALRAAGAALPDAPTPQALAAAAVEVGAQHWLGQPWQRRRLAEADRDLASRDPSRRGRGALLQGYLHHVAGLHHRALGPLEEAARLRPDHGRTWFHLAFVRALTGDGAGAREALQQVARFGARIPPKDLRRAELLRQQLGG